MQLDEWMKIKKISQRGLAALLAMDEARLSRILANKEKPTLHQVSDIYDITKGKVTFWDWIERIRRKDNG